MNDKVEISRLKIKELKELEDAIEQLATKFLETGEYYCKSFGYPTGEANTNKYNDFKNKLDELYFFIIDVRILIRNLGGTYEK